MTGYVRTDTTNNIADGNIINATDLDNEFDGVQAAFNSSTGHNHDGTTGEGAPILVLGPTQDVVVGAAAVTPKTTNTVDIGSGSLKFKDLFLAGNASIGGTLAVTGVATLTAQPVLSSLTASSAVATDASKGLVSVTNTGTGNNVLATSPTLVTPALGTPSSATLTNATGLPVSTGISGLGSGVATFLATPSSANLAAAVTDETGTGALVFANSPTLVTPALGTPASGVVTNLTGTASININGTVGATTASTGAFTTLTTSSTVTHNGGTANGVAFLNSSKVLTTGSALTFDGTTVGIGPQATSGQLVVADAITTVVAVNQDRRYRAALKVGSLFYGGEIFGGLNSSGSAYFGVAVYDATSTSTVSTAFQSDNTQFYISGSEQMRLTNTGLGIGTSSPASKLDVTATGDATLSITSAGVQRYQLIAKSSGNFEIYDQSSAATRVTLTQAGNLGLGVTPSAWGSGLRTLDIGPGSSLTNANSFTQTWLASNAFYDTSWKYKNTAEASYYDQTSGRHAWFVAPSGTAGNAISFTQAMTLDASGNWIVGGTSQLGGTRAHIQQNADANYSTTFTTGTTKAQLVLRDVSATATYGTPFSTLLFGAGDTGAGFASITGIRESSQSSAIAFGTASASSNPIERARITSGGDFGIGTSSPSQKLHVNGASLLGGSVFVVTSATPDGTTNHYSAFVSESSSRATLYLATSSASSQNLVRFFNSNGNVGNISVSASATTYATSSDYRLKNTIAPMTGALAKVALLKPCTYKWNADGSDGEGFIAHELQAVVPQCVTGQKDAVDAEGKPQYQGIDTSFLIATLTAAIQEQQAIINSLKARLDDSNL
jgi:hypothetical protein